MSRCNSSRSSAAAEVVDGFRVDCLLVAPHYKYNIGFAYFGHWTALFDIRLLFAYTHGVPERWCTVTVIGQEGRRHSLDVQASSTYDAAHQFVVHAKTKPASQLPIPTLATVFEVVAAGRLYCGKGAALQKWILQKQQEWKGPKGFLFSQRPIL